MQLNYEHQQSRKVNSTCLIKLRSTRTKQQPRYEQLQNDIHEVFPETLSFTHHKWKNHTEIHVKIESRHLPSILKKYQSAVKLGGEMFTVIPLNLPKHPHLQPRQHDDRMSRKIFIHNLPVNWVNQDLNDLFSHYGVVEERYICFKKNLRKKKNIGFVIFATREEALNVCDIKTIKYRNAIIRVKWATAKDQQQQEERQRVQNNYLVNQRNLPLYHERVNHHEGRRRREILARRREEYQRFMRYCRLKPSNPNYFHEKVFFRADGDSLLKSWGNFRLNKGRKVESLFSRLDLSPMA